MCVFANKGGFRWGGNCLGSAADLYLNYLVLFAEGSNLFEAWSANEPF